MPCGHPLGATSSPCCPPPPATGSSTIRRRWNPSPLYKLPRPAPRRTCLSRPLPQSQGTQVTQFSTVLCTAKTQWNYMNSSLSWGWYWKFLSRQNHCQPRRKSRLTLVFRGVSIFVNTLHYMNYLFTECYYFIYILKLDSKSINKTEICRLWWCRA
jgi:hypothetical protein